VVKKDKSRESNMILTGLKDLYRRKFPLLPKDYIARLVYSKDRISIAIVKPPFEVLGGVTYRPFKARGFAEITFCVISSDQRIKGFCVHLIAHLKDYIQATSPIMHLLTYVDNYAIDYFKRRGFTEEITLEKSIWMGYIQEYEGTTIMQCSMTPQIRHLEGSRMLQQPQKAGASEEPAYGIIVGVSAGYQDAYLCCQRKWWDNSSPAGRCIYPEAIDRAPLQSRQQTDGRDGRVDRRRKSSVEGWSQYALRDEIFLRNCRLAECGIGQDLVEARQPWLPERRKDPILKHESEMDSDQAHSAESHGGQSIGQSKLDI
jgi:N-acetylglutamate synthase-like GNAT family acetyltransferase